MRVIRQAAISDVTEQILESPPPGAGGAAGRKAGKKRCTGNQRGAGCTVHKTIIPRPGRLFYAPGNSSGRRGRAIFGWRGFSPSRTGKTARSFFNMLSDHALMLPRIRCCSPRSHLLALIFNHLIRRGSVIPVSAVLPYAPLRVPTAALVLFPVSSRIRTTDSSPFNGIPLRLPWRAILSRSTGSSKPFAFMTARLSATASPA